MNADFERKRVMNRGEYRVFRIIELEIDSNWRGYRVLSQTALGEVIGSADREAHGAINSKRADVMVIDAGGYPVLAVEVQGKGHFGADAAARDAVKKEALRKAGVAYLEIMDYHTDADIARVLRETMNRTVPGRAQPAA
jgi:very-short-patch-repair endonuclease